MTIKKDERYIFGRDVLGPIFFEFCQNLYLFQSAFRGEAVSLFAYRGGLRLLYLYRKYLSVTGKDSPTENHGFLVSRIVAIKAGIRESYSFSEKTILREYRNARNEDFIRSFFPTLNIALPPSFAKSALSSSSLKQLVYGAEPWAQAFQSCLDEQAKIMGEYLKALLHGHNRIILIDSGWTGTTQLLLMNKYKEYSWLGAYFGKWDTFKQDPPHFHLITGLSVEGQGYTPARPETAIFEHRHIIEGPLEPQIPSVEHLVYNSDGQIASSKKMDSAMASPQPGESHFQGVCDYFDTCANDQLIEHVKILHNAKMQLRKKILYPTRRDVYALEVDDREANLGKHNKVKVVQKNHGLTLKEKSTAVKRSLWRQGAISYHFGMFSSLLQLLYNSGLLNRLAIFYRKLNSFCC